MIINLKMRCNKSIYINLMKCSMLVFCSTMLFFSVKITLNILNEKDTSLASSKKSSIKLNFLLMSQQESPFEKDYNLLTMSICGKNWTVYLFALTLGAFWNVKHIKKIGVI